MSALLCGMHAAPNDALLLKLHILKALLACLRDSHRTRTIFRKVILFCKHISGVLIARQICFVLLAKVIMLTRNEVCSNLFTTLYTTVKCLPKESH